MQRRRHGGQIFFHSFIVCFVIGQNCCVVGLFVTAAEKRQADETLSSATAEPRKKKIEGDVSSEVVAEILEVTSDPKKMLGPDVRVSMLLLCLWLLFDKTVQFLG